MKLWIMVLLGLLASSAAGIDINDDFDDPELQARYRAIINETRCLVCQNQTIADSNAGLAVDLRREIRAMLESGASDREIVDFLVGRYGDFVLYRPPLKRTTWLLWASPVVFLLIGLAVLGVTLVRRSKQPIELDGE